MTTYLGGHDTEFWSEIYGGETNLHIFFPFYHMKSHFNREPIPTFPFFSCPYTSYVSFTRLYDVAMILRCLDQNGTLCRPLSSNCADVMTQIVVPNHVSL